MALILVSETQRIVEHIVVLVFGVVLLLSTRFFFWVRRPRPPRGPIFLVRRRTALFLARTGAQGGRGDDLPLVVFCRDRLAVLFWLGGGERRELFRRKRLVKGRESARLVIFIFFMWASVVRANLTALFRSMRERGGGETTPNRGQQQQQQGTNTERKQARAAVFSFMIPL